MLGAICETIWPKIVIAALMRPMFTIAMGTWFIQIGFILYNPLPFGKVWSEHDHRDMMIITAMFAWHLMASMIILLFLSRAVASAIILKQKIIGSINDSEDGYQALKTDDF